MSRNGEQNCGQPLDSLGKSRQHLKNRENNTSLQTLCEMQRCARHGNVTRVEQPCGSSGGPVAPARRLNGTRHGKRAMQTQSRFRLTMPDDCKLRTVDKLLAEHVLNIPDSPAHALAKGHTLARVLREQIKNAMRRISECPPAFIGLECEHARAIKEIASAALGTGALDPMEAERTSRQLACPSSLEDWIQALDATVQHHRAPVWFTPHQEQLDRIERNLALVAGHLANGGVR